MGCTPNTPVKWSDIHALVQSVDALAVTLSVPDYVKLVDATDMPFKFDDLVDFAGAVRFGVTPRGVIVTAQHLTDGLNTTNVKTLDAVLNSMGQRDDLYLVVEADDCWCKTLFKVDTTTGQPVLKQVDEMGCCQSLFVPQVGDELGYGQHIIPAGFASHYAEYGNPSNTIWRNEFACVAETTLAGFKFAGTAFNDPLTDCTREITNAKFTWPIRAAYYEAIWDKIQYILVCSRNGGATSDSAWLDTFEDCTPTTCNILRTLHDSNAISSLPGCIHEICDVGFPWEETTCGGVDCDGKPKVYCQTLKELEILVTNLSHRLKARTSSGNGCCCTYLPFVYNTFECRVPAYACNFAHTPFGSGGETVTCLTSWTETLRCDDGSDNRCTQTTTVTVIEDIVADFLDCDYTRKSDGCDPPDECFVFEGVSFTPSFSEVTKEALIAHAAGRCDGSFPISYISMGFSDSKADTCPDTAIVERGYYRVTAFGPDCPGSIKVPVRITKVVQTLDNDFVEIGAGTTTVTISNVGGGEFTGEFGFPAITLPPGSRRAYYVASPVPDQRVKCLVC